VINENCRDFLELEMSIHYWSVLNVKENNSNTHTRFKNGLPLTTTWPYEPIENHWMFRIMLFLWLRIGCYSHWSTVTSVWYLLILHHVSYGVNSTLYNGLVTWWYRRAMNAGLQLLLPDITEVLIWFYIISL